MSSKNNDFTVVTPSTHDWENILNEFQCNGTDRYKKCSKSGVSLCMCSKKGEELETVRQFLEIFTEDEISNGLELEPENVYAVLDDFAVEIKAEHDKKHHEENDVFIIA